MEPAAATVAGGGALGQWLRSVLDACVHSPFGVALLAEQASGQPACNPMCTGCSLMHPGCTPGVPKLQPSMRGLQPYITQAAANPR